MSATLQICILLRATALDRFTFCTCTATKGHISGVCKITDTTLGMNHSLITKYSHTKFNLNPVNDYRDMAQDEKLHEFDEQQRSIIQLFVKTLPLDTYH